MNLDYIDRLLAEKREAEIEAATKAHEKERQKKAAKEEAQRKQETAADAARNAAQRQKSLKSYDRVMRHTLPVTLIAQAEAGVKAQQAKKALTVYLASDKYKADSASKASNEAEYYAAFKGKGPKTDKEKELRAVVGHYEAQENAAKDEATLQRDMDEINAMTDSERGMLAQYITEREREKFSFLGEKSMQSARYNATELFNKYGAKRVQELAESYSRWQNRKTTEETAKTAAESAGKGVGAAIGQSAASVGANLVGAVTAPLGYLGEVADRTGRYATMDPNNLGNLPGVYSGAVRQQVAEDIAGDEGKTGRKILSYGYQGVMGAADSLARILAAGGSAPVSLGLAAMGSFGQTMSEVSAQGATPAQAAGLATATAFIEAATEKLPLDELLKTAKGGAKPAMKAIGTVLKQAGIEATTEEISLLGSLAAEAAILRDKSTYSRRIGDMISGGMSYEEAKAEAAKELWEDVKQTAFVSAISGGMSSGAATGTAYIDNLLSGISFRKAEAAPMPEGMQNVNAALDELMGPVPKQAEMPTAEEVRGLFPSEENPLETLYHQREEIEKQLNAATEAGEFGEAFNNLSSQWSEVSGKIKELEAEDTERADSLQTEEAPPERAMAEAAEGWETAAGVNPLAGRTEHNVGSQKVKAYQYENPEVKPFFQEAARGILSDIDSSTRGERIYNDQVYYESGGEKGWSGTKRHTTRDLAEMKDSWGYTWDELREAAEDIIHDRGKENNAASKRLEFMIHDRLSRGYTDIEGRPIPASTDYLNFLEERQVNEYRREGMEDLVANGERYAPEGSGQGFEAMGAASYNFNPFTRMQNEYGNIPDGENPVRPDDMPISTDGEDRVSYTARAAKGAQVTPDEFVPLIENEVVRGGFSFIPITNDQTVQNAVQTIMAEDWQTARANWTAAVRQGRTGADITAQGALLYNNAVNSGNYREAMDILLDYQQAVRNAAQAVQAARILKTLTPENRLYMLRRSIQRMVEDMHLNREIRIDEDLARQYQETRDDAEADRILDRIIDDVASQIPPTLGERITALRYLNMLGNFRTQIRNIAGNVGAKLTYLAKDELGATIEVLASRVSGGRFQRTKVNVVDRATRRAARADFENVADWVSGGGRTNDRGSESDAFAQRVNERRRILPPGFEQYRRATNWAMNNGYFGDEAFGREAYARALAGYLNARGIRTDNLESIDRNTLNRAREYAVRQAQEATFRDNNQVSDFVSRALRGRNTPAWARVIGEAVMPFRKTPANVLVRAEEFSPLGLINSAVATYQAARGEITGAELVESWAKSITGTGLFAIGYCLANMGMLQGGPDQDEEKAAFDELNGMQDYALVLPDGTTLTIDFLTPAALPMLLGAQMDAVLKDSDLTWNDLDGVFSALADPMIEMSMLQGINDTIDAIRYADNSMGQFLINAMTNYITQALGNTLLGQVERSTEDSRMTTYVDKDSNVPAWLQRNLGKLSQKVPGWDYQQTPYIDQWGREQKNPEGIKNFFYQLLSPAYVDKVNVDNVAEELYRLSEVQSDVNVFPQSPEGKLTYTDKEGKRHEDYNLTKEELDQLKRTEGQTQAKIVADLIGGADYNALTDEQKAKAVTLAYDYAREYARKEVLSGYNGGDSWMEGIEGKEAGAIINKVAAASITDAFSAMTASWRDGLDGAEAKDDLEEAYNVYQGLSAAAKKQVMDSASGRMDYFLTAKAKGMKTETFIGLYRTYWDIDQTGGKASDKAERWAYELEKAQEAGKITKAQKTALKGSMVYMQMFPAETEKFDQMTEAGISGKKALDIGKLLEGLQPASGRTTVTASQKASAIAGAKLTDSEKAAVMKLYLSDAQDKNIDEMAAMGYNADAYAAAYQIYSEEDAKGGKGQKARTIARIAQEFGVDEKTAKAIYEIYG